MKKFSLILAIFTLILIPAGNLQAKSNYSGNEYYEVLFTRDGISWKIDGQQINDYMIVWSDKELPTYPSRKVKDDQGKNLEIDHYFHQTTAQADLENILNAFNGPSKYFVRVCFVEDNGKCSLYGGQREFYLSNDKSSSVDTDGGINFYEQGELTGQRLVTGQTPKDYCIAYGPEKDKKLIEYYLNDAPGVANLPGSGDVFYGSTGFKCPNGCRNGACLLSAQTDIKEQDKKSDQNQSGQNTAAPIENSKNINQSIINQSKSQKENPVSNNISLIDTDRDGYDDAKEMAYNYDYKTPCGQNIFRSDKFAYGQGRLASLSDEQCRAKFLKSELDRVIGKGKYKISAKNWITLVNAFIYGGYNLNDVVKTIKGNIVIHPSISKSAWQKNTQLTQSTTQTDSYINLRGFSMASDTIIYGQVTDEQTGQALAKTYVNLFTPDGLMVLASATTNADGYYLIAKSNLVSQKNYELANTRPEIFTEFRENGLTKDFMKDHCRITYDKLSKDDKNLLKTDDGQIAVYEKYCAKTYDQLTDEEKFSKLDYNDLFTTDLNLQFNKGEFTVNSTHKDKYPIKVTKVKITDKAQAVNMALTGAADETITDGTLLYGQIIDAGTNQPLPNIFMHIILPGGGGGASVHKQTNANGFYQFKKSEFQNKKFDNQFYLSMNNGKIGSLKSAAIYIDLNSKNPTKKNIKL